MIKLSHRIRLQDGFTLLEMLIAVSILSVSVLAVASMQGVGLKSVTLANKMTVGSNIAQQVAEELMSRSKLDPVFRTSATNISYTYPETGTTTFVVPGAGNFTATYSVVPNDPNANTSKITVNISYVVSSGFTVPATSYTFNKVVI